MPPERKAFAPRWLVVTHRYVGVVMGLVMLMWFASGVVMLFVRWPELAPEARAVALRPIDWGRCCAFGAIQDVQVVREAVVEDVGGRPVLRVDGEAMDLATGRPLAHLTAAEATRVAGEFAAGSRLKGRPAHATPIERDQWTVSGEYNSRRPFWKVRLDDRAKTDVYVSAHTGEVALRTDGPTRLGAWFGAIPHWLYPTILRQNVALWSQVVIWTSLVGVFLTVTGLYLGIVAWRAGHDRRMTPFRGMMAWHHLAGLAAGLLTLTWVASGLVSMSPWGFLEGGPDDTAERIAGDVTFGDVSQAVLAAKAQGLPARQLRLAPIGGKVFLMADDVRLDPQGRAVRLTQADLAALGRSVGPVAHQGLIAAEDAYYHAGHEGDVPLPAWRVVMQDGTRVYLDPASGQARVRYDRDAKAYRWLFEGLHRLDFINGFDRGAVWLTVVIALLAGAGLGVATGVWLGWRRIQADLSRLRRPAAGRGSRAGAAGR